MNSEEIKRKAIKKHNAIPSETVQFIYETAWHILHDEERNYLAAACLLGVMIEDGYKF